jgi:DNA-binding FadR family transcriptional regulator
MPRLAPHVPLAEQVAEQLRQRIADGEFEVGSRLPTEHQLTEELGVSRNSVREALRSLVHAGLLRAKAGYGTVVVATSDLAPALARRIEREAASDTAEVRLILEREASRLAARRATAEQRRALSAALDARAQAADGPAYVAADMRFHEVLMDASGNALLAELYRGIGGNEDALLDLDDPALDLEATVRALAPIDDAHRELVDAVLAGDPAAASAAAERLVRLANERTGVTLRDDHDHDHTDGPARA